MKRFIIVLAASAMAMSACSSDISESISSIAETSEPGDADSTVTESTVTESTITEGTAADLAITEVVFDDHFTITNLGSGTVTLDGLWVCNRPNYLPLPTAVVAPGESIAISDLPMPAGAGEVALYSSNNFGDPSAMLDYVSWGFGGGRASVASNAGIWPADDAVATSGTIISAPGGGASSADWSG